jgi:hypothetical protein
MFHVCFFLMAILASEYPLFIAASVKKVPIGIWPPQLVSDITRTAVLLTKRNLLSIAEQPRDLDKSER